MADITSMPLVHSPEVLGPGLAVGTQQSGLQNVSAGGS